MRPLFNWLFSHEESNDIQPKPRSKKYYISRSKRIHGSTPFTKVDTTDRVSEANTSDTWPLSLNLKDPNPVKRSYIPIELSVMDTRETT